MKRMLRFLGLFLIVTFVVSFLQSFDAWGIQEDLGEKAIEEKVWEQLRRTRGMKEDRAEWLAALGEEAIPVLEKIVHERSYRSRGVIYDALGQMGDKSVTPFLLDMLKREEVDSYRWHILDALFKIGDPKAESEVKQVFEDEEEDVGNRFFAAKTLARIGSSKSKKEVRAFLAQGYDSLKRNEYLPEKPGENVYRELEKKYNSDFEVIGELLFTLGADICITLEDEEFLLERLKWNQVDPRWLDKVCQAIGELNSDSSIEALFELVENDEKYWPVVLPGSEAIPIRLGKSLDKLSDDEKKQIERWDDDHKKYRKVQGETRLAAASALVSVKDSIDIERLKKGLEQLLAEGESSRYKEEIEDLTNGID